MSKKKQITKLVHSLKKSGCITKRELDNIFRTEYGLKQLMLNSEKSIKEIKTSICNTQQQFNITYEHNYNKFTIDQIKKLSKVLEIDLNELINIIDEDIEIQKTK